MRDDQREFVEFCIASEALRFGEFVLKSGRRSPYFFNTGSFASGASLARLARHYAAAIRASGIETDMLYGPAYKGIPLAAATAVALHEHFGIDLPYCFNRKEEKDHGEGGRTVGAPPAGRVIIVDDVISAGTSVRESVQVLRAAGAVPVAVAIALDRQERGSGASSAIAEVRDAHDLAVISIVRLEDLIAYLEGRAEMAGHLRALRAYRDAYGAA